MADLTRTVDIIFKGQDQASDSVRQIEDSIDGISKNADAANDNVNDLGNQISELDNKPKASVVSMTNAIKTLAASMVVKDFIDANVQFENFQRTMTLLTGSTEIASQEFDYIADLSNKLGLEVLNTAKNFAQLTAATKGTKLEGQGTKDIFEAVVVAMANLGKSSYDTEGALLAIQQIASKGKVSMEELRQQLGERLPGALQLAADAMKVPITDLDDLVKGGLAADEFLADFAVSIKNTFGDVTYIETYTASLNRLKNSVTEAELRIGAAGGFDIFTKAIQTGAAAVVGAIAVFDVLGETVGNIIGAFTTGDFSILGESLSDSLDKAAEKTRAVRDALFGINETSKDVAVSASDALQPIEAQGYSIIYNLNQWEKYDKAVKDTAISLEKIASQERIAKFEAIVDLDIAQIEADAKTTVAAFDSISNSIDATSRTLSGLFDLLGDPDVSKLEKLNINDRIDAQLTEQQKLIDSQVRLNDAQTRLIRERANQLRDGGALITVNGDGLEPELEAFMWKILERVQIRANADGEAFLLGITA